MGRKLGTALAVTLLVSVLGASAPGTTASAEEAPLFERPTALCPGAYVLSTSLRLLTLSAALLDNVTGCAPIAPRLSGVPVEFWSGSHHLCTATTHTGVDLADAEHGIARCSLNLVSPGGLNALLTGRVEARFAGLTTELVRYLPSTARVPAIGPDAPPFVFF